ncbi:MAG: GreA/GreB family elongation factor [Bacilli bacterium]|nr:GreA/GreB family elongation factor [Bacilli bacterium]
MPIFLSRKGKEKIYQQYLEVDKEIQQTNKAMGESVKMDNDLRENPDFMALRVKSMYDLPKKKKDLYTMYIDSIVIEDQPEYVNFDGETVIIGSTVEIFMNNKKMKYTILGTNEGDLANRIIAENSPLAQALLGKKVGQHISFNDFNIEIVNVKI